MTHHFFHWFIRRFKPREGWLLFGLTFAILSFAVRSVSEAEWVPENNVVWISFCVSAVVTYSLVWRPRFKIWLYGPLWLSYLVVFTALFLMRFRPFLLFSAGWETYHNNTVRVWTIFLARINGWLAAVASGSQSDETLVFAFGLSLLTGVVVALFIIVTYRQKRPLIAVSVLLLLVGLNDVYSRQSEFLFLFLILLGIVYLTIWQQYWREALWDAQQIDYSAEMNLSTMVISVVVTFGLLLIGFILPALPYSSVARRFQQSAVVQAFERSFEQYFSGVNTNPATGKTGAGGQFVAGSSGNATGSLAGVLPRSYLLGNPPELADTPVFSAQISTPRPLAGPLHWRSGSYDIYTGFGWSQSAPAETLFLANQAPIPTLNNISDDTALHIEVRQDVTWLAKDRYFNLITLGQPLTFDQPVSAFFRPDNDLASVSRVAGDYAPSYLGTSLVVQRNRLVLSGLGQTTEGLFTKDAFYEHYTRLPDSLPVRVIALAEQITAEATNPYERATLIEQYLRQYPYNLDIPPVPSDVDPVDYFLFDLQEGYCDLYASSMVVMARSLGLPSRLGVGYLNSEADSDGAILITQDRGHSWAEIYFPGVGWVEFEPTAAFPLPAEPIDVTEDSPAPVLNSTVPEIPKRPLGSNVPIWLQVGGSALFLLAGFIAWQAYHWRRRPQDMGELLFWLQDAAGRLGYPLEESETATEFGRGFCYFLQKGLTGRQKRVEVRPFSVIVPNLVNTYQVDHYSRTGVEKEVFEQAVEQWQAIRRPLWQLWLWHWWNRLVSKAKRPNLA